MTLLTHAWADLFVLSAFQWSMSMDKCPLFEEVDNNEALQPMMQLFERFKNYRLDQGNLLFYCCLIFAKKILVL